MGLEPGTPGSAVQRFNHLATEQPAQSWQHKLDLLHADWKNADIRAHLAMLLLKYGFQSTLCIVLVLGVGGGLVRQIGVHTSHSDRVVYISRQEGGAMSACSCTTSWWCHQSGIVTMDINTMASFWWHHACTPSRHVISDIHHCKMSS